VRRAPEARTNHDKAHDEDTDYKSGDATNHSQQRTPTSLKGHPRALAQAKGSGPEAALVGVSWLDPARPRDLRWLSVITTTGAIVLGAVVTGSGGDSTWLGVLMLVIGLGCIPGTRRVWRLTREQERRTEIDR
jgi:hypothetical protein